MRKPIATVALLAVAVGIAGASAVVGLAGPDAAIRAGFRAAGAAASTDWNDDAVSALRTPVSAGEREARLWLGRDTPLIAALGQRVVRIGDRITLAGADGTLATLEVQAIRQLDGPDGASGRPLLMVVCRPADDAAGASVRFLLEAADEPVQVLQDGKARAL